MILVGLAVATWAIIRGATGEEDAEETPDAVAVLTSGGHDATQSDEQPVAPASPTKGMAGTTGGTAGPATTTTTVGPKPMPAVQAPAEKSPALSAPGDQTGKAPANPAKGKVVQEEPLVDDEPEQSGMASSAPDSNVPVSVPVKVDVQARLADRYPEVSFSGTPLVDAVRLIGRMSTLRIALDLDAMADAGAGPRDPITLQVKNGTTGEILGLLAAQRGLTTAVARDQVVLTLPQEKRSGVYEEKYDLTDLLGGQPSAGAELVAAIRKLVAPDSWRQAGGQGTIDLLGGSLTVRQTAAVHRLLRSFCRRLRIARGLRVSDSDARDPAGLATRVDEARAKLRQPVTVNFFVPTPLEEILAELEEVTGTTILVDWVSLGTAGSNADPKAMLQVQERPLYEALVELLQPLDLGYRIVGPDVFEVTTRKAAADRLELEFYPVKELLAAGQSGESLAARLQGQLSPATWSGAGGKGAVFLDKPSGYLIVLQSQAVQASVQILLRKLAAEKGGLEKKGVPPVGAGG